MPPRSGAPLPEFDRPPVSEVAIAVQFEPLDQWRAVHAGLFWGQIKDRYPLNETQPPLPSQIERYDGYIPQTPQVIIAPVDVDLARFWFLTEDKTQLIQLQRDRFIINWRKLIGNEIYPRYEAILRPRFIRELNEFREFLDDLQLGTLNIQQCEITYVNDILKGEGWDSVSDSLKLFSAWWGKGTDGWLPIPERLMVSGSFLIPEQAGRLHFLTQHLFRIPDMHEMIQLRLIARGNPRGQTTESIAAWLDIGREWIVRGFADLTSPYAHNLWGRSK